MPVEWIDLRSDTVTRPTDAMRAAMAAAEVGDDVYGEDPTVNALQDRLAGELGFEAALFVPSGTQSNLVALLAHCARGDEYLVGMDAHTYKYEGGGAAVLGGIQPQPLAHASDGTLPLGAVEAAIKPDDAHFARTRLLCLENTWHGRPMPLDYLADARALCDRRGLGLHLDGARLFNAAVAQGVPVRDIARHFDSVSVCLSKGLGAPVGSVLLGSAALHALDRHVDRLAEDHDRAARLASALSALGVEVSGQHTNMVFVQVAPASTASLVEHMAGAGVRLSPGSEGKLRLVLHLDVDDAGLKRVVDAWAGFRG